MSANVQSAAAIPDSKLRTPHPELRTIRVRLCRCCGAEYDLDNCRCKFWCLKGCGKCERHCTGHVDSDLLFDLELDRADDYDELDREPTDY